MAHQPVETEVSLQHALILQAWTCLIGDASVTYVSGPITTGPRWIEAAKAGSLRPDPEFIAANCETILRAARQLRGSGNGLVLEPASLHVETWSQDDYLNLWTTVIERHAKAVVFIDGWPFSIGCALEFERATIHAVERRTIDGHVISTSAGCAAIRQAIAAIREDSVGTPLLSKLAERLADVADRLEFADAERSGA